MTRQELIERINRQSQRAGRWGIVWLASFLALLGLGAIAAHGVSSATERVLVVIIIVTILTTVAALMLALWRSMQRLGLVCPHCHVLLTKDLWPVAAATGRCGRCGSQIVDSIPGDDFSGPRCPHDRPEGIHGE
jgi:lysylphosphatidylglycerol synthetase-like protein (DUF2156 family)